MSITEFSEGVSLLSSSRPKRISFASSLSVSSISFDSIWSGGSKLKFGGITNGGFSTTLYSSITLFFLTSKLLAFNIWSVNIWLYLSKLFKSF